ncbi:effector binding domain-containing protein [Enterococcus xiangfangensis]|uniref:Effector binding domain-containing protein n=1 Tax=Enterococcus xiangfangensis TaxID=1296537 RepID=A0ABU3F8Y4_9ENTE|nr:effector binding domain-containing protein [Enterococcus xiangfangensis]MDT2759129.1 effector binding domain-containing protein [Enterococcus xiangfangensis]
MTNYEIKHFNETVIKGYAAVLPLPTIDNIKEVSEKKSQHFFSLATSGKFPALMAESADKIGYALSEAKNDHLEYFAGANTSTDDSAAEERVLPAGEYVVLKGQGGPSRQLFDRLIKTFFGEILSENPDLYKEDTFVVEALLNGNPQDAEVELWIPLSK